MTETTFSKAEAVTLSVSTEKDDRVAAGTGNGGRKKGLGLPPCHWRHVLEYRRENPFSYQGLQRRNKRRAERWPLLLLGYRPWCCLARLRATDQVFEIEWAASPSMWGLARHS